MSKLRFIGGYLGAGCLYTGINMYNNNKRLVEIKNEKKFLKGEKVTTTDEANEITDKIIKLSNETTDITCFNELLETAVFTWPILLFGNAIIKGFSTYDNFYWSIHKKIYETLNKDN